MPENLELKAKIHDPDQCESIAKSIGSTFLEHLHQVDTYFNVPSGRLKLRVINSIKGELIYYQRNELSAYRLSEYHKFDTSNPQSLLSILMNFLTTKVIVEKDRKVWLYHGIRIHIDNVKNLGFFIEFEIPVVGEINDSRSVMNKLVESFSLHRSEMVLESYSDMLHPQPGK